MSNHLHPGAHPGPHPDPELLNAFAEGALAGHERAACALHLAECADCREIVFLSQAPLPEPVVAPVEPEVVAAVPAVVPERRKWFAWLSPAPALSGALALGALVIAMVSYRQLISNHLEKAEVPAITAHNSAPITRTPEPADGAAPAPNEEAPVERFAPKKAAAGSVRPAPNQQLPVEASSSARARSVESLIAVAPSPQPVAPLPQPAAPPPPASAPVSRDAAPLPSDRAQALGVIANGPVQPPVAGAPAGAAAPFTDLFAGARKKAALMSSRDGLQVSIEPGRGTADGLSQIQGSVTDKSGAAVQGALVTVRPADGTQVMAARANASGEFALDRVPAGRYQLQIESPGFEPAAKEIDVKGRDLASVASVLNISSATQTVEVRANAASVQAETTPLSAKSLEQEHKPLPSKLPVASVVSQGTQMIALDTGGSLFISHNKGKHWKSVEPAWRGKATFLAVVVERTPDGLSTVQPAPGQAKQNSPQTASVNLPVFRLTTDGGETWISLDGVHWAPEPPQH